MSDFGFEGPNLWDGVPTQRQYTERAIDVGRTKARAELEEAIAQMILDTGEEQGE